MATITFAGIARWVDYSYIWIDCEKEKKELKDDRISLSLIDELSRILSGNIL